MRVTFAMALAVLLAACAAESDGGRNDANWDSADGNPTHSTHAYMAEFAVDQVKGELPEVEAFRSAIVEGANLELHDLVLKKNPGREALRLEIGGNNWAAEHPELLWSKAQARYAAGDKHEAYVLVGALLHYVQDMGVPAHAFHVIHQSSPRDWDHVELLGFFEFHADKRATPPVDPKFGAPADYIAWSGGLAREQFHTAFPGETYARTFFPQAYDDMTPTHWAFLRTREADCSWGTAYALRSAGRAFATLAAPAP